MALIAGGGGGSGATASAQVLQDGKGTTVTGAGSATAPWSVALALDPTPGNAATCGPDGLLVPSSGSSGAKTIAIDCYREATGGGTGTAASSTPNDSFPASGNSISATMAAGSVSATSDTGATLSVVSVDGSAVGAIATQSAFTIAGEELWGYEFTGVPSTPTRYLVFVPDAGGSSYLDIRNTQQAGASNAVVGATVDNTVYGGTGIRYTPDGTGPNGFVILELPSNNTNNSTWSFLNGSVFFVTDYVAGTAQPATYDYYNVVTCDDGTQTAYDASNTPVDISAGIPTTWELCPEDSGSGSSTGGTTQHLQSGDTTTVSGAGTAAAPWEVDVKLDPSPLNTLSVGPDGILNTSSVALSDRLQVDSWSDFGALPFTVTNTNESVELLGWNMPRDGGGGTFYRVAQSGVAATVDDGGVNLVTANGAHYRREMDDSNKELPVAWFGLVSTFVIPDGSENALRFDKLWNANEYSKIFESKRTLTFAHGVYRFSTIRRTGMDKSTPPGIEAEGYIRGCGQPDNIGENTRLWFDIPMADINDGDWCITTNDSTDADLWMENIAVQGNNVYETPDLADYVDASLLPSFAAFGKTPGLIGVRTDNKGQIHMRQCQISNFKIGFYDRSESGHIRIRETRFGGRNLIGYYSEHWGGDQLFEANDLTGNAFSSIVVSQMGLVTFNMVSGHLGISPYGIYGLNDFGYYPEVGNPLQRFGLFDCCFQVCSWEGVTAASIQFPDDSLIENLSLINSAMIRTDDANFNIPDNFYDGTQWETDYRKYQVRVGTFAGSLDVHGGQFEGGEGGNCFLKSNSVFPTSLWRMGSISRFDNELGEFFHNIYGRSISADDIAHGELSQWQAGQRYSPFVGGGNLLAINNKSVDLATTWDAPGANRGSEPVSAQAVPLPPEIESYWADCETVITATQAAVTQLRMIMPQSGNRFYPVRPQDHSFRALIRCANTVIVRFTFAVAGGGTRTWERRVDPVSGGNEWADVTINKIWNPDLEALVDLNILSLTNGDLRVAAASLTTSGFARYSPYRDPQIYMAASDNDNQMMVLQPPTSAGGNAVWIAA